MFTFGGIWVICSRCDQAYNPMAWATRIKSENAKIKYFLRCPFCGFKEKFEVEKTEVKNGKITKRKN